MRAWMPSIASLVVAAGCTAPEGRFACTSPDECPSGWACRTDGLCWTTADEGADAGAGADARELSMDAPGLDALGDDAPVSDAPGLDAPVADVAPADVAIAIDAPGTSCTPPARRVDDGSIPRCSQFGGIYIESVDVGLPCRVPNPFTHTCDCPPGFDDRDRTSWQTTDGAGGVDTSARLHTCLPTSQTETAYWGGMYIHNDTADLCVLSNPLGSIGLLCDCGDGYTVADEWFGLNSMGETISIAFCTMGEAPDGSMPETLGSAYAEIRSAAGCAPTCLAPAGESCMCSGAAGTLSWSFPGRTATCWTDNFLCTR